MNYEVSSYSPRERSFGGVRTGAILAMSLVFAAGCSSGPAKPKLLLSCGAGIRPPVSEVAEEFGRRNDVTVECDYAGSEVLMTRIKLSKRGDLYMPGDVH